MVTACDDVANKVFGVTRAKLLSAGQFSNEDSGYDFDLSRYESERQPTETSRLRYFITLGFDPRDDAGIMPIIGYFGVLCEALFRGDLPTIPCVRLEQFRRRKLTLAHNDNATNDDEPIQALLDCYGVDW